jgi:hypothetical protein
MNAEQQNGQYGTAPDAAEGAPAPKKVRGRPFVKGQSGNPSGKPKPQPCPGPIADPEAKGVPQQLADMRHVYERPKSEDRTQGQKTCRAWLKEDRTGFMRAKTQLERACPQKPAAPSAVVQEEEPLVDAAHERLEGVIDELLKEWAEEPASIGRRVDGVWASLSSSDRETIQVIVDTAKG